MTAINRYFVVVFFSLMSAVAFGQQNDSAEFKMLSAGKLKRFGKSAMQMGDYHAATAYFGRYLKQRPDDYKIAFLLGESYRKYHDYLAALTAYEKAYDISKNTHAPSLYYFGLMLKMNGQCDKAKEKWAFYKKIAGDDDAAKELAKQIKVEIAGCDSVSAKKPITKIGIIHLDSTVNRIHVEGAPLYINDSILLYSALRTDKIEYHVVGTDSVENNHRKFYVAKKVKDQWTYGGEFTGPFNTENHDVTSGSFSTDGKRFYFTRCERNYNEKVICSIYISENENGTWSEPVKLGPEINSDDYTSTHPTVSVNSKGLETVYFVSDRKEGRGGFDIWYFTFNPKKKAYSEAKNVGNKINSSLDELAPYYDQDNRTLYFSSNGWPSMGGMDIFKSVGEMRQFVPPSNLLAPVNSTWDDVYYAISKNRQSGMVVSNRIGGFALKNLTCCDDLYEFQKLEFINISIAGIVYGGKDSTSKAIMKDAKLNLYIVDPSLSEPMFIKTIPLDSAAYYKIPLEAAHQYKFVAEKEGYFNDPVTISTEGIVKSIDLTRNFFLREIPKGSFKLENVYYATDKWELTSNSQLVIDTTLLGLLNENPTLKIEISSHTDDHGSDSYNMTLSQKRADGVVKYLISKGIDKERLVAKGYGETQPVAPNKNSDGSDNPVGREKNRRTEFKVIGKVADKEQVFD